MPGMIMTQQKASSKLKTPTPRANPPMEEREIIVKRPIHSPTRRFGAQAVDALDELRPLIDRQRTPLSADSRLFASIR